MFTPFSICVGRICRKHQTKSAEGMFSLSTWKRDRIENIHRNWEMVDGNQFIACVRYNCNGWLPIVTSDCRPKMTSKLHIIFSIDNKTEFFAFVVFSPHVPFIIFPPHVPFVVFSPYDHLYSSHIHAIVFIMFKVSTVPD